MHGRGGAREQREVPCQTEQLDKWGSNSGTPFLAETLTSRLPSLLSVSSAVGRVDQGCTE
jgi:hypothetical protein